MTRTLKYNEAICEALDLCMTKDEKVYLIGLGVPDLKRIFGTTTGLFEKYGDERVLDMPTSENGMTGIAIGSAIVGMRPVMVHQRMDFAVLAVDQIVNQAAKWNFTFGTPCPITIRMIVGRGWGQGPQHSQSLQAWFAHVPGLKVVMPATPGDAKGLMISAIEDDSPVVYIEHRWLHGTFGHVPEDVYRVPIGQCRVARFGTDVSIVATSYMVLEALQAAAFLSKLGVDVEVVDVRTLKPLDSDTIFESVLKTGRLIVADTGWTTGGFSAEVVSLVSEHCWQALKTPPKRMALLDVPTPSTVALAKHCYPRAFDLVREVSKMLGLVFDEHLLPEPVFSDVPDESFKGPF